MTKKIVKNIMLILIAVTFLFGFSNEGTTKLFEENGNTTEEHAELMQNEWCEYNSSKDNIGEELQKSINNNCN